MVGAVEMDFSQTITSKGCVPISGITFESWDDKLGCMRPAGRGAVPQTVKTMVSYEAIPPQSLAARRSANNDPQTTLVDLAACVIQRTEIQMPAERLFQLASQTGPLFACEQESLEDWAYAANSAHLAVALQETVMGINPIAQLNDKSNRKVSKYCCQDIWQGGSFAIFHIRLSMTGTYFSLFGKSPFVRRMNAKDGLFYYVFAVPVAAPLSQEGRCPFCARPGLVDVFAVQLGHEISFGEYEMLKEVFSGLLDVGTDKLGTLDTPVEKCGIVNRDGESASSFAASSKELIFTPAALGPDDSDAIHALVQMIVTVHLSGVSIDVFRGERDTGYLSFANYLSYLWLDFGRTSSKALLGYCAYCGKAFSLVGHRGVKRQYCSDECRTKAKNEASRLKTREVRELFLSGQSVSSIASREYSGNPKGEARVRERLEGCVELKHMLDDSIERDGWRGSQLLRRCIDEGVPMDKLLSKRRMEELRKLHGTQ